MDFDSPNVKRNYSDLNGMKEAIYKMKEGCNLHNITTLVEKYGHDYRLLLLTSTLGSVC